MTKLAMRELECFQLSAENVYGFLQHGAPDQMKMPDVAAMCWRGDIGSAVSWPVGRTVKNSPSGVSGGQNAHSALVDITAVTMPTARPQNVRYLWNCVAW